jgi:hypothetical protein
MSSQFATLYVDEAGEDLERLLAHLQRELGEEASVTWTDQPPVQGTTVHVRFKEPVEPSAEGRVTGVLEAAREDWSRFLGFAATPGPA